jgi:hypothetical protein
VVCRSTPLRVALVFALQLISSQQPIAAAERLNSLPFSSSAFSLEASSFRDKMVQEVIVVPKEELEDGIAPASSTSNGDGSDTSTVVVGFEYLTPGTTFALDTLALETPAATSLQAMI